MSNTAERGFVQPEVIEPPPVIVFRTASDITTGCLQSDEYLMNNFNVNYMVAVIREETFSWGAAKEVKTLVNAERSLCWGGGGGQTSKCSFIILQKCCRFDKFLLNKFMV